MADLVDGVDTQVTKCPLILLKIYLAGDVDIESVKNAVSDSLLYKPSFKKKNGRIEFFILESLRWHDIDLARMVRKLHSLDSGLKCSISHFNKPLLDIDGVLNKVAIKDSVTIGLSDFIGELEKAERTIRYRSIVFD